MSTQNKKRGTINKKETYTQNQFIAKSIIQIILLIILISMAVNFIDSSINASNMFSYTTKGNIDYKVYLKENNFYKDKYLGKDMTYITSLVDYIDIDFSYAFKTNEKSNIDYTYSVFANLVITPEDNSKVLFDEKYILKDNVTEEALNTNQFNITKTVKLDYNFYNDLANMFKNTYGVNCNSKLFVGLMVDTNGKDKIYESEFNNSDDIKICFSLAQKQVDIDMKSAVLDETEFFDIKASGLIKNKGQFMLGTIFIALAIIDIIDIVKMTGKYKSQKDGYTRYIDKILNNYDRAIVETHYMPDLDNYEVIEVSKFSELLDVRDTLRLPIIYTPTEEKESCFYIRHEHTIYMHYVKSTSLIKLSKFDSLFM